jgi:hypothetical protein
MSRKIAAGTLIMNASADPGPSADLGECRLASIAGAASAWQPGAMEDESATAERFAKQVYQALVIELSTERIDSLCGADPGEIQDPIFAPIAAFCRSLSSEQKEALALTLRQVATDALASFLAIVEGGSYLEGFNEEEFKLTYGAADIGRNIAELFLGEDERRGGG